MHMQLAYITFAHIHMSVCITTNTNTHADYICEISPEPTVTLLSV